MTYISYTTWIIEHDPSGATIAKFETPGGREIPDKIEESPDTTITQVTDLSNYTVDHSPLTDTEKEILEQIYPIRENPPAFDDVMTKIENAAAKYSGYWVYERLLGNTPSEMPEPLRTRSSVPDRDANGTPAEQAVDAWMDRYEKENSL